MEGSGQGHVTGSRPPPEGRKEGLQPGVQMIVDMKSDTREGGGLMNISSLRSAAQTVRLFSNCVTRGETEASG